MSKSLFYQFNSALDMCFVLHFDKHSDKHNPHSESDHIIKSLSAKSNLKDFAHDFAAFIKNEYGVKQVKQITPDMCQSYIERKATENCSLKTIKTYQSNLLKLSKCANKTFNIRTDYSVSVDESKIEKTDTIKQYSFTRAEMEKILAAPRSCDSLTALKFAYQTGVRVNTLERLEVRHIDFKNCEITIYKDKGNRTRVLPMSEETASLLRQQIKGKNPQDRVFAVRKGSVNRYLRRRCEKLNICTPNGEIKSGVHSIRKLWAEETAERYEKDGKNGTKMVMSELGHSEDRKDLEDTYLHSKK
ncbi:MAG: tyrosine-type recombinase/integrase [Clostridia bacterium]|nr:tyrosine-type recombinase/integrase [Clostridia bacterium]